MPKDEEGDEYTEEEHEEDIYEENKTEELEDDDEIAEWEGGFMEGYEEGRRTAVCATCNRILMEEFVEKEIKGKKYRFCNEGCAERFKKQ